MNTEKNIKVRMSVEKIKIPKGTLVALRRLAEKRGHSLEETLRHAVNTEVYMSGHLNLGNTILIQHAKDDYICTECGFTGGRIYKVVFTHMKKREDT